MKKNFFKLLKVYYILLYIDFNFGELEMCLNKKLRYSIKVKSRFAELFTLKKNDFLCLGVNFRDFIEKFLKDSLKLFMCYNEERKKKIEEYKYLDGRIKKRKDNN